MAGEFFWFCNINKSMAEKIRKNHIWGTSSQFRETIEKVKKHDKLIFSIDCKSIMGFYEASEDSKSEYSENRYLTKIKLAPILEFDSFYQLIVNFYLS